ncbi:hypothetical protein SERLA73DRAFT_140972 [Serpula lacrymans var. lacrymans S7.3]|uniref:Uncharacterized protein n=2 Tax=Serpula lacrymans var. lacrymans TaxID=341189 RepID=F8Q4L8_SERL3|nr:uncharacterized protein SERLADRAFT_396235 [Serpula lacrymans var. lacrymans S7.9]EGN97073.1 hypothetical protein SERLA73DRAFT_140972 [Serpula lacrymans var. lacrymans S7.3]EGO22675.1 hypothetical protein SERLADRAFT_396235 [Serpula lacrymans var. lacrymans S7.9]
MKVGLPVISVTENSKTLDTLLRFCCPSTLAEDPSKLENKTRTATKFTLRQPLLPQT